jgi:hypothetical protein
MRKIVEEEIRQMQHQIWLLTGLIGPILHKVDSDEEFDRVTQEYFDNSDNTVDDAKELLRMLCTTFIAVAAAFDYPSHCGYYEEVRIQYENRLAELN